MEEAIEALRNFDSQSNIQGAGLNTFLLIFVAPMLAAGVITLPVLYIIELGGWKGIAVGFAAAWLCAMMLAILAYVRFSEDIKGIMGRLIYDRRLRERNREEAPEAQE
jgi:hypothetical protein